LGKAPVALIAVAALVALAGCGGRAPQFESALAGPDTAYLDIEHKYTAAVSDPDGDVVRVLFSWGDGTADTTDFGPSGTVFSARHRWSATGAYTVGARSEDGTGTLSDTAQFLAVVVYPRPVGQLRWVFERSGVELSTPVFGSNGLAYTAGDEWAFGIDPADGMAVCSTRLVGRMCRPAIGSDGNLYLGLWDMGHGTAWLVSLSDSLQERWRRPLPDETYCVAVGTSGLVYCGAGPRAYCFDLDGTQCWAVEPTLSHPSNPVVLASGLTVWHARDGVVGLDESGRQRWAGAVPFEEFPQPLAVGTGGAIYLPRGWAVYTILDGGSWWWHYDAEDSINSGIAVAGDGRLYFVDGDSLVAVSDGGQLLWRAAIGVYDEQESCYPAVAADGTVYVVSGTDEILAFSSLGSLQWRFEPSYRDLFELAIGLDGTVYHGGDCVEAVWGSAPLADSPWPKFQRDYANSGAAGGLSQRPRLGQRQTANRTAAVPERAK
jgi:hypothetical protein